MRNLKVATIVGTRPEIIRLSSLIKHLDKYTSHTLVHTGQNYDPKLNDVFFEDLGLRKPDIYFNVDVTSFASVMADTLLRTEELIRRDRPDAVIVLGDTNSSVAAIASERMGVPVYHLEAGNRSFDRNVPEELNRRMVDHISTFNLPYNDYSLRNLLAEGLHPRFLLKTGSPMTEVYLDNQERIESSAILSELDLEVGEYFLASVHRQENVDNSARLMRVIECLNKLALTYDKPVLVSTHPRTRASLGRSKSQIESGVILHDPFGFRDYAKLQKNAFCVVSDSGTISEEASIMGFPAVTIRDSMERPEALETGSIVMSGLSSAHLLESVELVISKHERSVQSPEGYETNDFSSRVLKFIFSTALLSGKWSGLNIETH